jgi:hypothetical protein
MFRRMTIKFLALLLVVLMPLQVFAQAGTSYSIKKGEPAPYAGTLLDSVAIARIYVRLDNIDKHTALAVKKAVALSVASSGLIIAKKDVELRILKEKTDKIAIRKNKIIDDQRAALLNAELEKRNRTSPLTLIGIGTGVGAALTIVVGVSLRYIFR